MKIYAVVKGRYENFRIIALTVDKERAEGIAKIYHADVIEYNDAPQAMSEMPLWAYRPRLDSCEIWEPWAGDCKEGILPRKPDENACYIVFCYAEDEDHARKKAQSMITQYEAEGGK